MVITSPRARESTSCVVSAPDVDPDPPLSFAHRAEPWPGLLMYFLRPNTRDHTRDTCGDTAGYLLSGSAQARGEGAPAESTIQVFLLVMISDLLFNLALKVTNVTHVRRAKITSSLRVIQVSIVIIIRTINIWWNKRIWPRIRREDGPRNIAIRGARARVCQGRVRVIPGGRGLCDTQT